MTDLADQDRLKAKCVWGATGGTVREPQALEAFNSSEGRDEGENRNSKVG